MKKEQILLVVSVGVAGLVVFSNTGLYASVGADGISDGAKSDVRATVDADPQRGLKDEPPIGRTYLLEQRMERRKEPKDPLPLPPSIGQPWIRPRPWPEIAPAFWGLLREPMTTIAPPAPAEGTAETVRKDDEEEDPEAQAKRLAEEDRKKAEDAAKDRIARAAKLVQKSGNEVPCRLTPLGDGDGQPVWIILERWGQIPFKVEELNQDGKSVRGSYVITDVSTVNTVHFEKTLENEYNEERIRRGVRDSDRGANIEFATWIRTVLAQQHGWGIPAVRLAMKHLAIARAVQIDAALVAMIGETCQESFDLDEEVKAYLEYLQGPRASETPMMVRLGDAYERAGALHAAKEWYEKAAKLGDAEGRLRAAALGLRLAEGPADLDAAFSMFEQAQGVGAEAKARALAGMSAVKLRQGDPGRAVQLASEARTAEPASFDAMMALGSAQYAAGKYAEAEQAFATARTLERGGSTRAKSSHAMALLALDKLPEALAEAQQCLDEDALNYLDPLLVIGEVQQRWGDLAKSNGTFETAFQRSPRNPWVLLRLATIRLRDERPLDALAILGTEEKPGLLQIAPECVDALRVAGLAHASIATAAAAAGQPANWDPAIRFLQRAMEKDPKSADILYDLARVLSASQRMADSVAILERGTNANTGFAKNDARLLSLLAYEAYTSNQPMTTVYDAFDRARRAVQATWTKDWVEEARDIAARWDNTRVWIDGFDRAAGSRVGNGWDEAESLGTQIGLDGTRCVFAAPSGKTIAAQERKSYTGIVRAEDLRALERTSCTFKADPNFEFVVHLYVGEPRPLDAGGGGGRGGRSGGSAAELGFGRDRNGKMTLYVNVGQGKMFNVPVKDAQGADRMWPEDGQFHTVEFHRIGDARKGAFEILLDGEVIPTPEPVEISQLGAGSKTATYGIHVDGDQGAAINLWVETVEVERVTNRK